MAVRLQGLRRQGLLSSTRLTLYASSRLASGEFPSIRKVFRDEAGATSPRPCLPGPFRLMECLLMDHRPVILFTEGKVQI